MFDFLIVGAGYTGCILAERIATQLDKRVLIIDRRNHIGGIVYDYYNEDEILVHKHGLHCFFTNSEEVFQYLSKFTDWHFYSPRVLTYINGMLLPFPINKDTINQLYGLNLNSPEEVQAFLDSVKEPILEPRNAEEKLISQVGIDLYKKMFYGYTLKYWGVEPKKLDKNLTTRIKIRTNEQDLYYDYTYQVIPQHSYTAMFQKMIAHQNISVLLQTNYREILDSIKFDRLIYTGAIDEFFDYMYGMLPYRSFKFEQETLNTEYYQSCQQINYPNDYDYTRIYEFKYATGQKHHKTTIAREYPMNFQPNMERYYPIPLPENQVLFKQYKQEAEKLKNIIFCGRMAVYRYYSMGEAVAGALMTFKKEIAL